MKKKPRKTSKSNKVLLTIIIVIAAGVFIFSGIKLLTIFNGYKKGSNAYKQIEDLSGKTDRKDDSETVFFDVPALKAENSDTKGYLYAKDVLPILLFNVITTLITWITSLMAHQMPVAVCLSTVPLQKALNHETVLFTVMI